MPQPTLLSGVAGETRAYQGPYLGEQLVSMAEAFSRIKKAEKEQAMEKYKVMLQNIQVLPTSATELRKAAKKAGMPLPSDEEIHAIAEVGKQQQGQAPDQTSSRGQQPRTPGEARMATAGMGGAGGGGDTSPDAAAAAAQKKWQDGMTPQKGLQYVLNTWYARAQQLADAKFRDEKTKTDYNTHLTQTKEAGLGGDAEATGKLMRAAEIPFNITQLAWDNASPEHRKKMMGVAYGYETDAQKAERKTTIFNSLVHAGLSAADAYSGSEAMASGQPLSAELQKKMGAPTFEQLGKEADFMNQALQLGVPADKLQSVAATAAVTGSLATALPKGLQPVVTQEILLRQQQVQAEKMRMQTEQIRARSEEARVAAYQKKVEADIKELPFKHEAILAKLHLAEVTGENRQFLDAFKTMIAMKKNGVEPDAKELQKVLDGLSTYGVDKDMFDYLTGKPSAIVPGGDPMADELGTPIVPKPTGVKK